MGYPPTAEIRRSLAVRLTALFTLSTALLLVASAGAMYWILKRSVERQGGLFLADKIGVLRMIIETQAGRPDALGEEVQWEPRSHPHARYFSRVLGPSGAALVETPGGSDLLASAPFPDPVPAGSEWKGGRLWDAGGERFYLLGSAWARLGGRGGAPHRIDVALDLSREEDLLEDYRHAMAVSLGAAILLSALLGLSVARRGLRPLKAFAAEASAVAAPSLHRRIGPGPWPSELSELAAAFDGMLAHLEESFERLSTFSADLAHDLRTPLTNCLGEAEVALSKPRTAEEYRRVLESNWEELSRVARMIDTLLFLARADSEQTPLRRAALDAPGEMEAVRSLYEAVAEEQGVALVVEGEGVVFADQTLLRRALGNLLSNAIRHTPTGGKVILSASAAGAGGCTLKVTDTGEGFAEADASRLLDRFYRSESSRSRHPQGLGLGLAIVKSIMDLHGGSVRIEGGPSSGAVVLLWFPAGP